MVGIIWNNGTSGQCLRHATLRREPPRKGERYGLRHLRKEERCTSAVEGQPDTVSALAVRVAERSSYQEQESPALR